MKKIVVIFTILFSISGYSQEKISYNTKEGVITFDISKKLIFIETKEPVSNFSDEKIVNKEETFIVVETADKDYVKKTETLKSKFTTVEPVLIYKDGTKQICFNEIIIKIKPEYDIDQILINQNYNSAIQQFDKNQYLVKLNNSDTFKTFNLINSLSKDNRIEFIEPNFIRLNVLHTNDPFYSSQWAINNNGYLGGTTDADMDVDGAWTLSTGLGVKVAVIDEGVDLLHPDLQTNLLGGYDATGSNSNGSCTIGSNDAHGTACAGIIGAIGGNSVGTIGIAYNSKIIPVRVGKSGSGNWTTDIQLTNGINWAWQNGADVLSNSWGGGNPSTSVNNAINNAVTNGRNGKGCVVLFSTGNENSSVSWPASNSNVIAVGASNQCDQRKSSTSCDGEFWWGSNFGTNLDVVAPGVKIYTTDISGSTGYETGDYRSDFNGTSSACPNAAGVIALILSVKPSLTGVQARQILESSTDKVSGYVYNSTVAGQPNGTWNNEVGYGRINASKAVFNAINPSIIGSPNVCVSANETYTLQNYTNGFNTIWSVTTNLQIVNQTAYNVVVKGLTNGIGTLTATFQNGMTLTTTIVIGANTTFTGYYVNNYGQNAELKNSQNYYVNLVQSYINTTVYTSELQSATWSLLYGSCNSWTQFPEGGGGTILLMNLPQSGDIVAFRLTYVNSCGISEYQDFWFTAVSSSYMMSPNPTSNNLTVAVVEKTSTDQKTVVVDSQDIREINVVDKTGIIRIKQSYIKGTKQMNMDISSLNPDVYIVNVFDGNLWTPLKLIKK